MSSNTTSPDNEAAEHIRAAEGARVNFSNALIFLR